MTSFLSRGLDKVINFLGFKKLYAFIAFVVFGGATLGFTFARLSYIDIDNVFCKEKYPKAPGGECYYFRHGLYKAGITLHLACVMPASFLAILQFIPAIRQHFMLWHRISGTLTVILILCSNLGAAIIANHSFGGSAPMQGATGTAVFFTTFAIINAYYNVKRLQLDQHRAWMLRSIAYLTHNITMRFITMAGINIITRLPQPLFETRSCVEMATIAGPEPLYELYPECRPGYANSTIPGYFTACADWFNGNIYEKTTAVGATFPLSAWLGFTIHVFAIELYLAATTTEAKRLRQLSYERQAARGMKNPGSTGFFVGKYGDVPPFVPDSTQIDFEAKQTSSDSSSDDGLEMKKRSAGQTITSIV